MSIKHIMSQPLRTIEITSKQTAANFARILNMRVNQETGLIEAEHTTIDSAAIQEPRVKTFETDTTLITVTSQFNIVSNTARLTLQEDFKNGAEGNNIDPERETYKIRTSKGFFTAFRALTENLGFKIPSQDLAHITQTKTQAESFVGNHTTSLKKCLAVSGLPADHIIQKNGFTYDLGGLPLRHERIDIEDKENGAEGAYLDLRNQSLYANGKRHFLPSRIFNFLSLASHNQGKVVTKQDIEKNSCGTYGNILLQTQQALEAVGIHPNAIKQRLGIGFIFNENAAKNERGLHIKDGVYFNKQTYKITGPESEIHLTSQEGRVLSVLANNPGHILSKRQIMDAAKFSLETTKSSLIVYISKLNKKLSKLGETKPINAVKGLGFILEFDPMPKPEEHEKITLYNDIYLDLRNGRLTSDTDMVQLTKSEFILLETLARNPNRAFERSYLETKLTEDSDKDTFTVEYIRMGLSKKLKAIGVPDGLIKNEHGMGDYFDHIIPTPTPETVISSDPPSAELSNDPLS